MVRYERRIGYLDYLEYESKIKNGGFVKTEVRDGVCRLQMAIKGLYPTDTLQGEIFLIGAGGVQKADTVLLRYGTSDYMAQWEVGNLAGCGLSYEDWCGVEIRLSEHRRLLCMWRQVPLQDTREVMQDASTDELRVESVPREDVPTENVPTENVPSKDVPTEKGGELCEDKWTQLTQYYRKARPFGDNREYLSVSPEDFIILREKYQRLVGNSFLLHGYYNYGHLILERQIKPEGNRYYLGVPGIYHEREKQVAELFGFVGFEGAGESCQPGEFGYYMLPVEI